MKTITFYSYKGGVGRSLTLSNIAMRLADFGKKVCIIDFDLEAPGLHLKFGDYLDLSTINKGIVEYISDFQNNNYIPQSIKEHTVDISYNSKLNGSIEMLPAGNINSNDYWKKLSSINWNNLFYSDSSHGIELLLHLKELIKKELKPDFLLIDSRTGITDTSSIAMTLLADTVVTLAANNEENISGIARIIKSLKREENNLIGKLPNIHFVLTRIPYYPKPEDKYKELRLINKAKTIINEEEQLIEKVFVIHSDPELEEEEKFKINFSSKRKTRSTVPIEEDYLLLFGELTKDELTKKEIKKFEILKEVEYLIDESKNTNDSAIKIRKLNEALILNSESHEALILLANVLIELEQYKEALDKIDKAIFIKPESLVYQFDKAHCNFLLNRYKIAEKTCSEILEKDPKHYLSLHLLGDINLKNKKYEKALEFFLKLINIFPDIDSAYNAVSHTYRMLGDLDRAFEYIYKALDIHPQSEYSTTTLAEIYLEKGNMQEFYKNLQLSLSFGLKNKEFQRVINEETIYRKVYNDNKFHSILNNYRLKIEFPK
ncbi:Mrp family chromosome partitioning ATPase [Winogradskyella eximia]|uniref:Mrp family chromosome partitioning ATPase n=1 Tax=Winogradskyella eximia TaxID=262006 RepID=A0A3D9H738_9FLAO|nr:CDC27 family protein [Winogradskyella eximia]RED45279.1 Mrp family chromosome partitioning ATPase [Winogradskyella eximia]